MSRSVVETLMGALVIIIALSFVIISYQSGNISSTSGGYRLTAQFQEVGTLGVGSDLRISGIKVGSVVAQNLDQKTYRAVLTMTVNHDIKLPDDSSVAIMSDGLLGGKYVSIFPGASEDYLTNGDEIHYTQDSMNLETLLGKFAFGSVGSEESEDATSSSDGGL